MGGSTREPRSDVGGLRPALESVSGESETADCHPVILEDSEGDTERLLGTKDASRSGLVVRDVALTQIDGDTETAPRRAAVPRTDDEETMIRTDIELPPELLAEEIAERVTETRTEKRPDARFDAATAPMPVPGDISGALETVPLNAALVQHVLAQVDARAAARAAASHAPMPIEQAMPPRPPPPAVVVTAPPPRRVGVEIAIAVAAFLAVAGPALYYLFYVSR